MLPRVVFDDPLLEPELSALAQAGDRERHIEAVAVRYRVEVVLLHT